MEWNEEIAIQANGGRAMIVAVRGEKSKADAKIIGHQNTAPCAHLNHILMVVDRSIASNQTHTHITKLAYITICPSDYNHIETKEKNGDK